MYFYSCVTVVINVFISLVINQNANYLQHIVEFTGMFLVCTVL